MKEKKFSEKVENIYKTLSNEEKAEYIQKQNKLNKAFLIIGTILSAIVAIMLIVFTIFLIIEKEYALLAFTDILLGALIAMGIGIIISSHTDLKSSDEIKVKNHIQRLELQKEIKNKQRQQALFKNVHYRLDFDNIIKVSILDSYTEVSDKLHAILNYQEIIQTRVYKFKVDYRDGTSSVITATENSEEYNALIPLVNKNSDMQIPTTPEKNNIGKLREYKQLLDEGIITQEEFNEKKKELL